MARLAPRRHLRLFNATHGTVLAVAWRALVDADAGDKTTIVAQLGTMTVTLAIRLWLGRAYGAPCRFAGLPAWPLDAATARPRSRGLMSVSPSK